MKTARNGCSDHVYLPASSSGLFAYTRLRRDGGWSLSKLQIVRSPRRTIACVSFASLIAQLAQTSWTHLG